MIFEVSLKASVDDLKTYSDAICDWLVEEGYTHCFFVAGGNIMHLLNSARSRFICVPVVHEVTAGISAEYFNEISGDHGNKAFALVTAGPGLTNIATAIAAAQIESRSLLVIGGQVKSSDLSKGVVRQRGIQELDGVELVKSICKVAKNISTPTTKDEFLKLERVSRTPRKGVVFLEICLDTQGQAALLEDVVLHSTQITPLPKATDYQISKVVELLGEARRPILLIGGGISRQDFSEVLKVLGEIQIPVMCTWNGADRVPLEFRLNWGRPNTWGMRASNVIIQQSDLLIAVGTRLGLQQTGFNWEQFAPLAKVVHVDIDRAELTKGHPRTDIKVQAEANDFLIRLVNDLDKKKFDFTDWIKFGELVLSSLPNSEMSNNAFEGFWNPYQFMQIISSQLRPGETLVPSSSGAAETVAMQAAVIPRGSYVITNKGMASMGYGLAGAIGAAFQTKSRVLHVEGDGGFAQNLQELGTVRVNNLPIKTFILDNGGYASIRMTQKSYFDGQVVGCDRNSGLGLPNWKELFRAYGITCEVLPPMMNFSNEIQSLIDDAEPRAFLVPIHPDQTYFPKITSRILPDGKMVSNPLHLMSPDLSDSQIRALLPHLRDRL